MYVFVWKGSVKDAAVGCWLMISVNSLASLCFSPCVCERTSFAMRVGVGVFTRLCIHMPV